MGLPGLFFDHFYNKLMWKNYPSSMQCCDLNPQSLDHESYPMTTRPGLPHLSTFLSISVYVNVPMFFVRGMEDVSSSYCKKIHLISCNEILQLLVTTRKEKSAIVHSFLHFGFLSNFNYTAQKSFCNWLSLTRW